MYRAIVLLFAVCLCASLTRADYQLTLYPNNTTRVMGDSVSISWAGDCSIEYTTGCYDWLSVYPANACVDGAGENTCYMTNNWWWVDNLPLNAQEKAVPQSSYQSGNWTYQFLAPGDYQFRIVRCACGNCVPIADDMLTCPSYPVVTVSPVSFLISPDFFLLFIFFLFFLFFLFTFLAAYQSQSRLYPSSLSSPD